MRRLMCPGMALAMLATTALASKPSADALPSVVFTDVTAAAGIKFTHNSGRSGRKYLPETLGAGGAFVDVDGDGYLDVVLVNGKDWQPKGRASRTELYHNNGNGTF